MAKTKKLLSLSSEIKNNEDVITKLKNIDAKKKILKAI